MGKSDRSSKPQSLSEDRLADLIDQILAIAHEENHPMDVSVGALGRYQGELWLDRSSRVAALADEVLAELGPNSGFLGSWELLPYILDRLEELQAQDPTGSAEDDRRAIAAGMKGGVHRDFAFLVTCPTMSNLTKLGLSFGQGLELSIESVEEERPLLSVGGLVTAATREGAAMNAERVIDVVLGAVRVFRFAHFIESRTLSNRRPEIWLMARSPRYDRDDGPAILAALYADRLASISFDVPSDLSELERSVLASGDAPQALTRHLRGVERVLAGTSKRAREVQNACRLAISAEHSLDFGVLVTLAFSCLEGLLLPPHVTDNVLARLSEAVAHSLGGTVEQKDELRTTVKKLYDVRSVFVHTGSAVEKAGQRRAVLDLMYRVLRREADQLPEIPVGSDDGTSGPPLIAQLLAIRDEFISRVRTRRP